MKVYYPSDNHTIFFTPAVDHPDCAEFTTTIRDSKPDEWGRFVEYDRKLAIQFTVRFRGGVAEVSANLGKVLIDQGLAFRKPVAIPPPAAVGGW